MRIKTWSQLPINYIIYDNDGKEISNGKTRRHGEDMYHALDVREVRTLDEFGEPSEKAIIIASGPLRSD